MKGLTNEGNTCFVNAALQCLLHVPALTNYVLGGWADAELRKKRTNACALAREYLALVKAYWGAPEPRVVSTAALVACLRKVHKPFGDGGAHDAHEALVVVVKSLHDALSGAPRITPGAPGALVAGEDCRAWDAFLAKEGYSVLSEVVVGQTACVVEAGTYASTTHEHFWGLSLDIDGCTSVAQALAGAFGTATAIEGFLPPGAAAATTASVTRRMRYAPLVLVVHLKRFDASGAKVDRFLDYSTTLALPPPHGDYRLFAVCMHDGGHYVAACEAGDVWRVMDDAGVSEVNVNAAVQKSAYLLLYKKCLGP